MKFRNPYLIFFLNGRTDKWVDTLMNGFLLGTFYVRESSQESVSTQHVSENFNGIKLEA